MIVNLRQYVSLHSYFHMHFILSEAKANNKKTAIEQEELHSVGMILKKPETRVHEK